MQRGIKLTNKPKCECYRDDEPRPEGVIFRGHILGDYWLECPKCGKRVVPKALSDFADADRNEALEEAAKKADAVAKQVGSSPNHKIIIGTAEIIATNIRALKTKSEGV